MQGRFPNEIQYEEHTLTLLASGKPFALGGTVRFVQVLSTTDATDSQEFSVNDGATWTRLRKGICPRFTEGTTGLKLRNNTGADVDVVIATGMAAFDDRRLVIDPLAGTVPVAEQKQTAVFGTGVKGMLAAQNGAAPNVAEVLIAAGVNVAGLRLAFAGFLSGPLAGAEHAEMYATNGVQTMLIAAIRANQPYGLQCPIIIPAGYGISIVSTSVAATQGYALGWEVM